MQSFEGELVKATKAQNEEIFGLETVEYQMGVFDAIPYNVQLGELLKSAKDDMAGDKKEFADMMVMDHTKANEELKALAKTKNISLPDSLNEDSKTKWADLAKATGKDFDKAYVSAMVDDHKKTVSMFEDASKNLKDPELKAFVDKTLPVLKGHLTKITAINDGMK